MSRRLSWLRGRWGSAIAIAALLLVVLGFAHHAVAKFALSRGLSLAVGYNIDFGEMALGWSHATFEDVHVRKNGDPVLDAARIDVDYALRDVFPGGRHRYGFAAISIDRPTLTLVRHADGTFNVGGGGTSSTPPKPAQNAAAPLLFTARLRDGTIKVIDDAPMVPDLREQSIAGVSIDASVQSDARTVARMDGVLIGRRAENAPIRRWPLEVRSVIDYTRGFAMHRFRAPELPIRGLLNFLVHAKIARFDDGVVRDLDVKAYAIGIDAKTPFTYRLGGGGYVDGARVELGPLARPVRDLRGRIVLFDDGVTAPDIHATAAGVPLHIRGGMFDFADVHLQLGIAADAQLANLRHLFTFLSTQDIRGPLHVETLVTGTTTQPLIRTVIASPHLNYGDLPLDGLAGTVDYEAGVVSFTGVHLGYGALRSTLNGQVHVDTPTVQLQGVAHVSGPAEALPYAQNIAAGETMGADAIITGDGPAFSAHGTIDTAGAHGSGAGFFAVDRQGTGDFGPFLFTRDDGSVLAGGFRLERPRQISAGWASVEHYRFAVPPKPALLPGVQLVAFPPVGGIVDAQIVAGGPSSAFAVAGRVHLSDARFETYPLGTITADMGGSFSDMRLRDIALDGPRGRFRGDGAVTDGVFAVRGLYDGSFPDLEPFTGDIGARGAIHAPAAALVDERGITVQTAGAVLRDGSIHGVALNAAAGTMQIGNSGSVRIITGRASLAGAQAVAAARDGETAISMVGVPAAAFAGSGMPLTAGRVSVFGLGDLTGPTFHGSIDLDHGRAAGFPIGGWVDIAFDGRTLDVRDGIAALGATYGRLGGRIDDVGGPNFRYDLDAGVSLGDIGGLVRDLHLPVRYADGSFAAQVQIAGRGLIPSVAGTVRVPEGSYNGLSFRDGSGRLNVVPGSGISVDDGRLTVGSTRASFSAALAGNALSVSAASDAANLADFDDYFDQSGMLTGRGSLAFAIRNDGRRTTSSGRIALTGARVWRLPFGTVDANWSTRNGAIAADATVSGHSGSAHAVGTIVPAPGDPLTALTRARIDLQGQANAIDLGTVLPAAGIRYPVLGRFSGEGRLAGVFPRLAIGGHAVVDGGQFGPFPVTHAEVTTHIAGDRMAVDSATADLGFMRFGASGDLGVGPSDPLALHVHVTVPDLATAARRIAPRRPLDVSGSLEADALLAGTLAKPQITAGFDLVRPRYAQLEVQRIVGTIESDLHSVKLDSAEFVLNHGSAVVAGSLPLALSGNGLAPADAPLSITADAHSVDLSALAGLLPGSGTKLTGTVDGHLAVEGTLRAPRILGTVGVSNVSYVSNLETTPIKDAGGSFVFEGTSVALQAFHAQFGAGTIDADGRLSLGGPNEGYAINITAKNAQFDLPAYGSGTIDGSARLLSGTDYPTLSGDIRLSNGTIPFAAVFRAAGAGAQRGPAPPGAAPFDLGFDLHMTAQNMRIRSPIIDVGAAGSLTLTGTLREPRADGKIVATRGGVFSTYQRLFRIQDATVTFNPEQGIVPNLDMHATAHVDNPDPDPARNAIGSADITVALTGPADAYTISFSSQPQYSEAQILALLVNLPVLGSINFGQAQLPGTLRGAPGMSDALLPPGVTPYKTGATPIQQEAFSLVNTQLTQRLLSPLENSVVGALGLTDLELTLDYGGRVGFTARQRLSKTRPVYATVGQILSYPSRTQLGFVSQSDPFTSLSFTYFQQNGTPYYRNSIFGSTSTVEVVNGVQPLSDRQGFSILLTRKYR